MLKSSQPSNLKKISQSSNSIEQPSQMDKHLEPDLNKAVEFIQQQSQNYHNAGLTHISSLLD